MSSKEIKATHFPQITADPAAAAGIDSVDAQGTTEDPSLPHLLFRLVADTARLLSHAQRYAAQRPLVLLAVSMAVSLLLPRTRR